MVDRLIPLIILRQKDKKKKDHLHKLNTIIKEMPLQYDFLQLSRCTFATKYSVEHNFYDNHCYHFYDEDVKQELSVLIIRHVDSIHLVFLNCVDENEDKNIDHVIIFYAALSIFKWILDTDQEIIIYLNIL